MTRDVPVAASSCRAPPDAGVPGPEDLAAVQALYDRGLFLQAYAAAGRHLPLTTWRGTAARILAGRLAGHLGGAGLGRRLLLRAWRDDPGNWRARYFYLFHVAELRGPLEAWRRLDAFGDCGDTDLETRSDLLVLRGFLAAQLRDFEAADRWFAEADRTGGDRAWLTVERCRRLKGEDRYDDALEEARRGVAAHAGHWGVVGMLADALRVVGRDAEALEVLRREVARSESGFLTHTLYGIETELELHAEALRTLSRLEEVTPLADATTRQYLAGCRSTCCYRLGDLAEAARWARLAGEGEPWGAFAARLDAAAGSPGRRVQLSVGFVRQHYRTCSPATLTALSLFWGRPAEHLEVAEAICYDGTPSHSERSWAERNGWVAREFTVTLEAARALLDRGVPFIYTTVQPGSAHAQAVVGYDDLRQSLMIRDPGSPQRIEVVAAASLAAQAASGPRGMVLVPADRRELVEGIDLPDAALYDLHHTVLRALDGHDRTRAVDACQGLHELAPDHRLTHAARWALAAYDANPAAILRPIEALLKLYPDDPNLQLAWVAAGRDVTPRAARIEKLRELCARKGSDPLIWRELAAELGRDGREHASALRWLDRVLRRRPTDAPAVYLAAEILWALGRFEEAGAWYRFAACLDDKHEGYAASWFNAAAWLKRTGEVMEHLTRRCRREGARSSQPARTLAWAHLQLDQPGAALAVLEDALARRPDDGPLALCAVEHLTGAGQLERAGPLLERARGQASAGQWARAAAAMANRRGALGEELGYWQSVLVAEPMAIDACRAVAFLLAETEGRSAALGFLRGRCQRFPHFLPLRQLEVEWLRESEPSELADAARALVATEPTDAWGHRELAGALSIMGRHREAHDALDLAAALEPNAPALFDVRGLCYVREGRHREAREQFQESLRRGVDNPFALPGLIDHCVTPEERRAALDFVRTELIRQTTFGPAILAFAEAARPYTTVEELLGCLREAQAARPDLWQSWIALASHLVVAGALDEALALAVEASRRFPLVPRVWLELARVRRARREADAAIESLETMRRINPGWGYGVREMAETLEAAGRLAESLPVLRQLVARSNQDAVNHGALASSLWKLGDRAEALAELREAVLLDPGYDWAWDRLREWSSQAGDPSVPRRLAEDLTARRPGDPRSWWLLARMCDVAAEGGQRLEALERALALNARFLPGWELKASTLAEAGRFADALEACRPPVYGDQPPATLRATEAWVIARQGDLPQAIRLMRAVLEGHPAIDWAWRALAEWHSQRQEWAAAAEAAGALSRLQPLDPVPLGYRANLHLREGNRDEAKADLTRAFELDAGYTYAGLTLFDLQVEDEEWALARQTLNRLAGQVPPTTFLGREIEFALAVSDAASVPAMLTRLCALPDDDAAAFHRVGEALKASRSRAAAERAVRECLPRAGLNPCVPPLWVALRVANGRIRNSAALLALPADSEGARRGLSAHLDAVARYGQRRHLLLRIVYRPERSDFRRLMRVARDRLHRDDLLWGKVGFVLAHGFEYRKVAAWLDDWRERSGVQPWMLDNLLLALQQSGRDEEARALIEEARALPRGRGELVRFDLFHALARACAGDPAPGEHLLGILLDHDLDWYEKSLSTVLRVAVAYAGPDPVPPFDRARKEQLAQALGRLSGYRACRQLFKEVVDLISRRLGRSGPRWWGRLQRLRTRRFMA